MFSTCQSSKTACHFLIIRTFHNFFHITTIPLKYIAPGYLFLFLLLVVLKNFSMDKSCLLYTSNLIFVICFHMGVAGVATATVISQCVSALLVLRCLLHETDSAVRVRPVSYTHLLWASSLPSFTSMRIVSPSPTAS